jgi:hypothetical protein
MALNLTVHDKEFLRESEKRQERFLRAAAEELHRLSQEAADTPNTGVTIKLSKAEVKRRRASGDKFRNKTQRTVYPNPAPPGHAPHRRTGFGRLNIVQGFSRALMASRVGYTRLARYMTFHELGIRYTKVGEQQRPTIMPALRNQRSQIRRVAMNSIRGAK